MVLDVRWQGFAEGVTGLSPCRTVTVGAMPSQETAVQLESCGSAFERTSQRVAQERRWRKEEVRMRAFVTALLVVLVFAMPVMAKTNDLVDPNEVPTFEPAVPCHMYEGGRDVLYDNGPFETMPGYSVLQNTTLGSGTYGFGHQVLNDNRISDDFVVPVGETWNITSATFFAYQTGSSTISTITDVRIQIFDAPPDIGTLVWGDLVTNRLNTSAWTGVYRILESDVPPLPTGRPIMASVCNVVVTLDPGQYWFVWQCDGSLSSGPWAPPITIPGQAVTGDGLQWTTTNMAWLPVSDAGDLGFKGLPFIIEGSQATPVENASWGAIKAMYQ